MYNFAEFTQNIPQVFSKALYDEVVISDNIGNNYRLVPLAEKSKGKSPFDDIPKVKINITTQEIVKILHESRAGI
jgi:hypothetical protein